MTSPALSKSACPGCGLELEVVDGPTHDYIGASPACWALYGQVLARDYGEYGMPDEHKFVVDAYAIQHPGENEPRARQSVGVHLIRLCLMLEREKPQRYATALMTRATHGGLHVPWFDPVTPLGTITAADVLAAEGKEAHIAMSRKWAEDQWAAWAGQHEIVRRWCDALEAQLPDYTPEID
ncbi:MAG: hypothetical protein HYX29_01435 [Solirubrobacterales bacterium]|nr:hypothetical protein [Solirubrobacterales bacterium]